MRYALTDYEWREAVSDQLTHNGTRRSGRHSRAPRIELGLRHRVKLPVQLGGSASR